METVEVFGYSERGIFNSIVFYLKNHPEKITDFLKILDIKDDDFFRDCKYTFLNEQSFSDFGDNDWTIIANAKKDDKRRVIFIEGKVNSKYNIDKEFNKILNNKKYDKVSSNIFAQLYYKYLLTQLDSQSQIESLVGPQVKKIGKNKIVNKAYNNYVLGASSFYYVAILPINVSTPDLIEKFELLNLKMKTENVKSVYWGNIKSFFEKINPNEVIENFEYNNGQIY